MLLQKVLNILTLLPAKHQKLVMAQVDFVNNSPSTVFHNIIETMLAVTKNAQQREILQIYSGLPIADTEILDAFNGSGVTQLLPLSFTDEQVEYIQSSIYRNRDGKFRIIPRMRDCSPDAMPLEGLDADEEILASKLTSTRMSPAGTMESFDGLKTLRKQPYDGPYDGVYKLLAPNISRVQIISSFAKDDANGFFQRGDTMYRNVCSQMTEVDPVLVNNDSLDRAMFLLFLVSGGTIEAWTTLYRLIHFMIRVPNSSTGYIMYLNDFDAGGNGKSKLVAVMQAIFGDAFTAFAPQQLRFTISLMGKRLVSISEYEDNEASKPLQGMLKSMTGRDRFQYEGKGTNPIVAETYQNFIISSNRYIHFEDSGIKRRLQNFHCSNLLHLMLNRYCKTQDYLNVLFGNVFNGESLRITHEMAHSLLNYVMHDNNTYSIPIRPQSIVLGSLKNPVLRALFAPQLCYDGFVRETKTGSAIDLFRLAADAKPEQFNYAATTLQGWFPDVNFEISRDAMSINCALPETVIVSKMRERLAELDETSRQLRAKNRVQLEIGTLGAFNSQILFNKFIGPVCKTFNINRTVEANNIIIGI